MLAQRIRRCREPACGVRTWTERITAICPRAVLTERAPAEACPRHRGRKPDLLYRIRKLLLTAAERLTERGRVRLRAGLAAGHPTGEMAAAWQGKELLRAIYVTDGMPAARAALERFYHWADAVGVAELSRLARMVRAWEAEIVAFHTTDGCSNGPTEAANLLIKSDGTAGSGPRVSWSLTAHRGRSHYRKEPAAMARIAHRTPIHLGLDVHRSTISMATLLPDAASAAADHGAVADRRDRTRQPQNPSEHRRHSQDPRDLTVTKGLRQ